MKLELVRYRDVQNDDYLYFWTEVIDGTNVHMGPMFDSIDDANEWLKEITEVVKNVCKNR